MNREHVGVNRDRRVFQVDQNFDDSVIFTRGKSEQRMLVELEVFLNHPEFAGARHASILLKLDGRGRPSLHIRNQAAVAALCRHAERVALFVKGALDRRQGEINDHDGIDDA